MNKLPIITLSRTFHRNENQILIGFNYSTTLIALIKNIPNTRWSITLKSWYLKNTPKNLKLIYSCFNGHAIIDGKLLFNSKQSKTQTTQSKRVRVLNEEQKTILNNFYKYLRGKRYSKSTIDTYTFFVADFIEFHTNKIIKSLTNKDVELFIEDIFIKRHYSVSTQRQFISALKLFVAFYPEINIISLELVRPKKSRKLPSVLSQEEILDLIRCTQNLKHRAIIALIYSCGLRVSELINLKLEHINVDRKQLLVANSKGRKDRYISLADSFIPLLSNYFFSYNPKTHFVEGQSGGKYSAESIRQFLKKNCKVAGIFKQVTPHTLRHSYATHLLENGVDIRYIQTLLGHSRPETTMIYTHVKRKDLMQISNPLDVALQKMKETTKTNQKVLLSRNIHG